jgi:uncharacterized protein YndB with AHSA1/START domain
MTTATEQTVTTQVYRVFLKATPEAVWEAITSSEWAVRYGYRAPVELELRKGGVYRGYATGDMLASGAPEVMVEGEVLEVDAPRRLVQTWHALFGPETAAEAVTRLTWELEPLGAGSTKLTVTHELEGAPLTASIVDGSVVEAGGGWPFVLSDLKTLLETGSSLAG